MATLGKAPEGSIAQRKSPRAVVGAPGWVSAMIEFSGTILPVKTRTFELADEQSAWAWIDDQ